jgi:PleD family two-component response regulator
LDSLDPISQVSHKLRTPMTVIMSTVNNLLDGAFGPLNEEQSKWLKKLVNHTANLEKLLTDILTMMKKQVQPGGSLETGLGRRAFTGNAHAVAIDTTSQKSSPHKRVIPRILVVDDEQDILDVVEEGLKMKGFETVSASNCDDALKLAVDLHPDLILMDVLLGNQNGMDVCHRIKTKVRSFTPVILMTGQDDLREKVGAANEADDLLSKPFQIAELFARVKSMLKIKELSDELEAFREEKR